jgi:hypothetical protein
MYHWSPSERFDSISEHGLVLRSPTVTCAHPSEWISMSPDPMAAWGLSGALTAQYGRWDLWMVRLGKDDEVHVLPGFGPLISEVQVGNSIGIDRLWHVATRTVPGGVTPVFPGH